MDENSTPTDLERQLSSGEEYTDAESLDLENDSEIDDLYTDGEEMFENQNVSSNPSFNSSEELQKSHLETPSEDTKSSSAPRFIINVPGILNTDMWNRECTEQATSPQTRLSFWRAGFIKHIGTEILVAPPSKPEVETPINAQETEDNQTNSIMVASDTNQIKLPRFVTSVKNRMSIFRGKKPIKFLGKIFITLHEKLTMAKCNLEEIHQSYVDERTLIQTNIEKRKMMLDQAKKDALIVNTYGKLFGRSLLSVTESNPLTASIEAHVLAKYVVVSPMEVKACSDKIPVHLFVRKVVEEHATVVFGISTCLICLKLLTLLRSSEVKHLGLRLDKMGVYGDIIHEYLTKEYTNSLPSNVYFHGLHPEFIRKCYSVIEKNSDLDAMVGLFPDTYDLIIVGGTSLGLQTVFEARLLDVKVCLIDSPLRPAATRPITFLGKSTLSEPDVSKKILYYLLSLRNRARKYQGELNPDSMQRIHSDWSKLAGSARKLITKTGLNNMQSVRNVGAGFLKCGVKFLDHHTVEITNSESEKYTLRSSYFVMANPMQHRIPNIPGSQYCFTPDQIFSLPNSPGKTLIYGATRSAMEYAGLLGSMGFPVTIMAPGKIMEECDGDMVQCIRDNMKNYGITIIDDCVLTSIKLHNGGKDDNNVSRSDETLYKFRWNPMQNKYRKKKKKKLPRRRGRLLRQCEINKVVEQALLSWDVSPKVLRAIIEAGPAMRQLKEENGIDKFDAIAHKKKLERIKNQKAAIQRWFSIGDADDRFFGRLKRRKARARRLRKRRLEAVKNAGDGRRTFKRSNRRKQNLLYKFVALFLSPSPDERTMNSLNVGQKKKYPFYHKQIRYGPHYSYNPKSRVGVYFPGGTALRLSKKSKYFKYLAPIKSSKKRKFWPSRECQPANEFIACLENLKNSLQDNDLDGFNFEDISSEEIKGKRADDIIQDYNKEHFDIVDMFKSHVIAAGANGVNNYNFEHKHFEEYMLLSVKNIDRAMKKLLMISREIDFKSQCLTIIRFLANIVQTLRMFHLYINWKILDCKKTIRKPIKRYRDRTNALQILNDALSIQMQCKIIRKSMFNVIKNLETLMSYTFISACNLIGEGSNECNTESEDISNRGSSLDGRSQRGSDSRNHSSTKKSRKPTRSNRYKDGDRSFNIRRFFNKSRYIRTWMGGKVDLVDPFLSNKNAPLYFDENCSSPFDFGSSTYCGLAAKSSVHELNSELKKFISVLEQPPKSKKVKKIKRIKSMEISENIINRLRKHNAEKIALEEKDMSPKNIVNEKESLEKEIVTNVSEPSPPPLPDRKKVENLRIRGVHSELHFTESCFFRRDLMTSKIADCFDIIRGHKRKFNIKVKELSEKSLANIKTHNQIMIEKIINEKFTKYSQTLKENKTKLNFRNFVASNFGARHKVKSSLSERGNYLSRLVLRTEAKAKVFKPLKWKSLAMYQKKVSRDRNMFLQNLIKQQKVKTKPRNVLYKYGVSDSISERLGLSTVRPRNTSSLISLSSLQRVHPQLFKSSPIDDLGIESSVLSREFFFRLEDEEKSSNYLDKLIQAKPKHDDILPKQEDELTNNAETKSPGVNTGPSIESRKTVSGSKLSTEDSRREILKNTIEDGTKNLVDGGANIAERVIVSDTSSTISEHYTYTLKVAPSGIDRSTTVNLDSYIKGNAPVVDLRLLGTVDGLRPSPRPKLNLAVSVDIFSKILDRYESYTRLYRNKRKLRKKITKRVSLPTKDFKSRLSNLNDDGLRRSPKPSSCKVGDGILQKDGASKKYTNTTNFQSARNIRHRRNNKDNKQLRKKRQSSRTLNQLQLQQLHFEPSEDGLKYGVIPLDGRAQIEYQLEQRLKKIREEAKSFSDLLENLKQYAFLSKIVKLWKLRNRSRKKGSEKPSNVEPQLFPDHTVYKVTGKFKNGLLDDFKEYFNTIIIAGRQMCPSQDINFHDIGVTTCHFNGKIYTNFLDQTTVPTVYGIGECVYGWPFENYGSVIAAQYLVRRLFSDFQETQEVQLCMRSVQTYPLQYAFIGLSEEEARRRYRKVVTYIGSFKSLPDQWISDDDVPSMLKFVCYIEAPEREKVVGIHFYNEHASDTIHGYAVAMKKGLYYKEVQDLTTVSPINTECVFQFNMDRKEYENLDINEGWQTDTFETDSSSQSEKISQYEETESECLEDLELGDSRENWNQSDEHESSISSESAYSDENDSYEYSHEELITKNEDQDIPEMSPLEEVSEEQEIILEEEDSKAAGIEEEEENDYEESVKLSKHSISESKQKLEKLDSARGSEIHSRPESIRLASESSSTMYMSICSPSSSQHSLGYSDSDSIHYGFFTGKKISCRNKKSLRKKSVEEVRSSGSSQNVSDHSSGTSIISEQFSYILPSQSIRFNESYEFINLDETVENKDSLKQLEDTESGVFRSKCPYGPRSRLRIMQGSLMKDSSEESAAGPHTGYHDGLGIFESSGASHDSDSSDSTSHSSIEQFIGESEEERTSHSYKEHIKKKKNKLKFQCKHTSKRRYKSALNTSKSTPTVEAGKVPLKRGACSNNCIFNKYKEEIDSEKPMRSQKKYKIGVHSKKSNYTDKQPKIEREMKPHRAKGSTENSIVKSYDAATTGPNVRLDHTRSKESNHNSLYASIAKKIWEKINLQSISAATRTAMRKWFFFDYLAERDDYENNI